MPQKDIVVLPEIKEGKLESDTYELLNKGADLAQEVGGRLYALLIGHNLDSCIEIIKNAGPDVVLVADNSNLQHYHTEIYLELASKVLSDMRPGFCLLGYAYRGIELGPALAVRLGGCVVNNCIDLQISDGKVRVTRPMFSGTYHAKAEIHGSQPFIVSFQRGALGAIKAHKSISEIQKVTVELGELSCQSKVIDTLRPVIGEVDITKAEVIVAVGRGIAEQSNIDLCRKLAEALGGTIACSRPISDLGWLPEEYHVGISGKTVAPKLYIACGISGASQHVAGITGSQRIIAINKDPYAPIFGVAQYGIVADIFEVIPELILQAKEKHPADK